MPAELTEWAAIVAADMGVPILPTVTGIRYEPGWRFVYLRLSNGFWPVLAESAANLLQSVQIERRSVLVQKAVRRVWCDVTECIVTEHETESVVVRTVKGFSDQDILRQFVLETGNSVMAGVGYPDRDEF